MLSLWTYVLLVYSAEINTLQVQEMRIFDEPQECIMFAMSVMEDDSHDYHAACVPTKKVDRNFKPRINT